MTNKIQTPAWFRYPKFNWDKKHAVIIGAGIAGCQITWHLVQQGWQVTLIDREQKIAKQASGNPAGIISPKMTAQTSSGEDFYVNCFNYAIKQLSQLKLKNPNLDWHACGLLQLAHNDREQQRWEALKDRCIAREFDNAFLECVDETQSTKIAGIPIHYKASYFPQAGWINPVSFCEVLLKDCGDNCELILETDVINLLRQDKSWEVRDEQHKTIVSAEIVIVTSGKDLNQFPQTNKLPSMPVAGQTTSVATNAFAEQLKTTIGHEGYLTPVSDSTSQLTFGASFDRDVDKAELNPETDKSNLEQLSKYLSQLADSFNEIHSAHAAIRMTTPDRFPYFGGIADSGFYSQNYADLHQGKQFKEYPNAEYVDGLFVLAGLGSRGLTTSGLCAKLLSDIINNVSNKVSNNIRNNEINENTDDNSHSINDLIQQHCHPARFIIKNLKRNKANN